MTANDDPCFGHAFNRHTLLAEKPVHQQHAPTVRQAGRDKAGNHGLTFQSVEPLQ
ncbi:MAG: hypothetical protein LBU45_02085 [Azoarcus sp.]|nr:hypothetical protein [Azoarcus sp.]